LLKVIAYDIFIKFNYSLINFLILKFWHNFLSGKKLRDDCGQRYS